MRKFGYGLIAASALAAIAFAGPLQAQPYGQGYGMGYGMMGGGYGPGGMMGPGYGMGYGMMGGYGPGMMPGYGMMGGYGPGMMRGYGGGYGMGPGMMQGYGGGPGMMYGYYGNQANLNLTTDQVKQYLERMIRNPNLTVGDVKEKDADTITADIVTKQGSQLVQRLDFNRHNGFVQPEQ
jgi:hypothetical protein